MVHFFANYKPIYYITHIKQQNELYKLSLPSKQTRKYFLNFFLIKANKIRVKTKQTHFLKQNAQNGSTVAAIKQNKLAGTK